MVEINLLPWRDAARHQQYERVKHILIIAVMLTLCLVIAAHLLLSQKESRLREDMASLEQDLRVANPRQSTMQNEKTGSNAGILTIAAVDTVFAGLGRKAPHAVCFTKMTADGGEAMELDGLTRSPADLAGFLLDWTAASVFTEIHIEQLQHAGQAMQFRLRGLVQPEQNEPGAAVPADLTR